MKDEREVLTRQTVVQKLKYESQRSMVGALMTLVLGGMFFGMLSLLCAFGLSAELNMLKLLPLIFYIPVLIVCAVIFARALARMLKAQRGEFTVTQECLTAVKDNQLSLMQLIVYGGIHTLLGNKAHLNHVFEFESGKKFIANVEEYKNTRLDTAARFSLEGDSFYLVYYNDTPDKIVLLFSSKAYNYKDND